MRDVVPSGDAVVETGEGVVFARGGLVGERVCVALEPSRGRVRRARIVDVLTPSEDRVSPPCAYATRCGGCALMHASLAAQRALRTRFLRDALVKAGAPTTICVATTETDQVLGYRRRARLAFSVQRGARRLGFRRERSHELVDVAACMVLSGALGGALTELRARLLPQLQGEGEIHLALGREGAPVVVIHASEPQPPALYAACDALAGVGVAGIALYAAGLPKPALFGDPREYAEGADGGLLAGTVGGFSQAHVAINQQLVARVAEHARTDGMRVLELYAGSGNLTVALAPGAASYTAVEQSPEAVRALRENLAARGLSVKVVEGDAGAALTGAALDVVVLDPPRTGAPGVLAGLLSRKPKRFIYVSCDPATLGRDVSAVLARGYAITHAEAFEMFPQTADLESLVVLERKG